MTFTISDADELTSPNVHDAQLLGIQISADKNVTLLLERADRVRMMFVMRGVLQLRVDDFRLGNIILDVTVSRANELSSCDVAFAYGVSSDDNIMKDLMNKLSSDGALVVRVNPSYGATLTAVCRSVEVN